MARNSGFDELVEQLSTGERRMMLERIRATVPVSTEPVLKSPDQQTVDLEREYKRLGWLQRLLVLLESWFSGADRYQVTHRRMIREVRNQLATQARGLLDPRRDLVLPGMAKELEEVRARLTVLATPCQQAAANRPFFVATLLSMVENRVHADLLAASDPFQHAEVHGITDPDAVRRACERSISALLGGTSQPSRDQLYAGLRFVDVVLRASRFGFRPLIEQIRADENGVPATEVAKELLSFLAVLAQITLPPSIATLEALVVLDHPEVMEQPGGAGNETIERFVLAAEDALARVRLFHKRVPGLLVLRYLRGDINASFPEPSGGEDWQTQLGQFWHGRLSAQLARYVRHQQSQSILDSLRELTGDQEDPAPVYRRPDIGQPGAYDLALRVLREALAKPWTEDMLPELRTVIADGVFYKPDNREEFRRSIGQIAALPPRLASFSRAWGPGSQADPVESDEPKAGQPGLAEESPDLPLPAGTIPESSDPGPGADQAAREIVRDAIPAFGSLAAVLNGVLFSSPGARYDTLSNLGQLGGRRNAQVRKGLERSLVASRALEQMLLKAQDMANAALAGGDGE